MKDMVPKGTGNSRYLKSVANFMTLYPTYADFVTALVAGTLPVDFNGINSAGCNEVGTPLNKANLLTDDTAGEVQLIAPNHPVIVNVNDAILGIVNRLKEQTNVSPIVVYRSSDYSANETIYLTSGVVGKTVLVLFDGKSDGSTGAFGNLNFQLPTSVEAGAEFDMVCMYNSLCTGTPRVYTGSNDKIYVPGNVYVAPNTYKAIGSGAASACVFKLMIDAASSGYSLNEWVARGDI